MPGQEDPWRKAWQPTRVFLPGEPHGQRGLVGHGPRGAQSRMRPSAVQRQQRTVQDVYTFILQIYLCCMNVTLCNSTLVVI